MTTFPLFRSILAFSLLTAAACTAGTSGPGTGTGTGFPGEQQDPSTTKPAPSGSTTAEPPSALPPPAEEPDPDPTPTLDKTKRFTLTLEGQPVAVANVTAKIEPASGSSAARIVIAGSYEQDFGPNTSTATFTVRVEATEKGADACGSGGRSADYWFKDTDGALRQIGTFYQGGTCTMTVLGNAADDFSSGTVKGTLGGAKTKSFTLTWGQPLP